MNILVFRYNISFIDPPLGVFDEIFPEVMIDDAKYFLWLSPSGNITSGNISPNIPRSWSINDKNHTSILVERYHYQMAT